MLPQLREVIEKVLTVGKMTQAELALRLYGTVAKQGKVSGLLKVTEDDGREKHWQTYARLLIIAINLNVVTEQDLQDTAAYENDNSNGGTKADRTKAHSRK